jgi:hypothetical protein
VGAPPLQREPIAQALPQLRLIVGRNPIRWERVVKVRATLLAVSLVALGLSSAPAEPLLRSVFGGAARPRPPGLVGRVDHPYYSPMPRSRPTAVPSAGNPKQKTAAALVPANPGVVTIGPAAVRGPDAILTGNTPVAPVFPQAP